MQIQPPLLNYTSLSHRVISVASVETKMKMFEEQSTLIFSTQLVSMSYVCFRLKAEMMSSYISRRLQIEWQEKSDSFSFENAIMRSNRSSSFESFSSVPVVSKSTSVAPSKLHFLEGFRFFQLQFKCQFPAYLTVPTVSLLLITSVLQAFSSLISSSAAFL